MKNRNVALLKRGIVVAFLAMFVIALVAGTAPARAPYISSKTWTHTGLDSAGTDGTKTRELRTDSLTGGTTGAPLFYYDLATYVNQARGVFEVKVTAMDTTKGGTSADTARDSLVLLIYTAWKNQLGTATGYCRANETLLDSVCFDAVGFGVKRATWVYPKVRSGVMTTALGNVIYGRIQSIYRPQNKIDTLTITYQGYATWLAN